MVKLKGCHFIHESMLYFALRCSRLLSSLLNHLKLQQQPIFRTINRSSYDVHTFLKFPIWLNVKCVLKCGFIKVCVQLGVVALQKMHKMGQKPFVSAGLMDICLVKEGRLSHIDEKGLSSCSIEILIPQKTRIKIAATATETVVMHEKKFTLLAKMRQSRMEIVS